MSEHKQKEREKLHIVMANQAAAHEVKTATEERRRCCLNCQWFVGNAGDISGGACHRYPPSVFPIQGPHGPAAMNMWPPVKATGDWCGEFAAEVKIVGAIRLPGEA